MLLTSLPSDILIWVLQSVSVRELASLSRTCRLLNSLVTEFGWTSYLRANPRPSFSLSQARLDWSAKTQARYDFLTDCAWSRCEFVARPFSRPWSNKLQPILAISPSRLVIAAGPAIISYKFGVSGPDNASPPVHFEGSFSFYPSHGKSSDITGITFVDDAGLDLTLCIGFQNGTLQHLTLTPPSMDNSIPFGVVFSRSLQLKDGDFVESLSSARHLLLSLSSSGSATLTDSESSAVPEVVQLNARSWTSHLCLQSSGPYAAFGTSSAYPLRVHSIRNDELSQTPSAILHTDVQSDLPILKPISSAVYGISRAPLASPWGASPQVLVSGWFDGKVRCHDLRSSSRTTTETGRPGDPTPLRPMLTMRDPLQLEPIYSVSCGGGFSSHVAAGSARHSVVCFWDVRFAKVGWSVHAPGNDRSPVYSVILESSRLYGATQSRPFVYDFGPEVASDSYPTLPQGRGIDGLKRKKGSSDVGYYVTTYPHTSQGVSTNET